MQSRVFDPTRAAAQERLSAFLPLAGRVYADQRNFDRGPDKRDAVSTLSPYMRHRLLTEQEVVSAAYAAHGPGAEKFITEVFWRVYWKGYLELRPGIFERYARRVRSQTEGLSRSGISAALTSAEEGRTGIDAFDHWARELVETGYLHNHARMWFASIWIFTLRLPWELGADFFMRNLLDGDPASNTLSWRWVSGLHTRGKNYVAQRDNITRYTEGRFFPMGLIKAAPPLDETATDPLRPLASMQGTPGRPYILCLTEEDLGIETLPLDPANLAAVFVLNCASRRSTNPVAQHVLDFVAGAIDDTVARVPAVFPGCTAPVRVFDVSAMADAIEAMTVAGVSDVVIPHVAVGPTFEAVDSFVDLLAQQKITSHCLGRTLDKTAWPLATRGFFQFREKIPDVLAALGVLDQPAEFAGPRERQRIVIHQR